MDMANINFLAVIVATLSAFAVGGLWYGPLFGQAWLSAVGMTEEEVEKGNKVKIFVFLNLSWPLTWRCF